MKRSLFGILSILTLLLGSCSRTPQSSTANSQWTDHYAEAREGAHQEHKMLLLDFTGSDWCPACIALRQHVLNSEAFAHWANDRFVLVELDFPAQKPQPEAVKEQNIELQAKYKVAAYPTVIILDSHAKELTRTVGYDQAPAEDWMKEMDAHIARLQD